MKPSVAVFEPNPFGHRLGFVRELLEEVADLGLRPVWVTSALAASSEEAQMELSHLAARHEQQVVELPPPPTSLREFRGLGAAIERLDCLNDFDFVYFPSGDGIAQVLGMNSRVPGRQRLRRLMSRSEILVFGGQFGYPASWRRRLRNRAAAWSIRATAWRSVFHLDPYQHRYLRETNSRAWQLMPDPVEPAEARNREQARIAAGLPDGGICLGTMGWIDRNKGISELARAFADALPELPGDAFLLLAGKFEAGLKDELAKAYPKLVAKGRLRLLDGLLSSAAFRDVLHSIDVMCLAYHRANQSSGIFLKAVACGTPVLANQAGWFEHSVRLLQNGWLARIGDRPGFAAAIRKAVVEDSGKAPGDKARIGKFLAFHSPGNFRATWTGKLRKSLGKTDDLRCVTWQEVLA